MKIIRFKPREIYLNLDFNKIKRQLVKQGTIIDYDSVIKMNCDDNAWITIDRLGEITLYSKSNKEYSQIINKIKGIIKNQIPLDWDKEEEVK